MKSAVENLDPTRVKVTVETPFEELKTSIDAAYRDIASQINVPGFRKGKVPARIIDQRIGRGAVIEQAVNSALPELYRSAIVENELKPLGQPEVEISEIPAVTGPLSGQLVFAAEVDVRPEIVLPSLKAVAVEVEPVSVTDDDVEARLTSLRERFGSLTGVDRAAEDDDFVVVDLVATVDGEEVESVSGISYQVGAGNLIEGLDDALRGMSAGDSSTFVTTLVAGEHKDADAEVTVTLTEVKVRELPEADDEFAQLASEFDTIDELRADLRVAVEKDKSEGQAVEAREKLVDHLRTVVEFPLPERIVDAEVASHLQREGKEQDDPHGVEVRQDTEKALRDQLLLDELAEQTKVEVGQDELLQFLFTTAQQMGMDPSEFITSADQNGQIPMFVGELARNKSVAVALRRVTVKDTAGADVDLSQYLGEDTEAEAAAAVAMEEAAAAVPAKAPAKKGTAAKKTADDAGEAASEEAAAEAKPVKKAPAKKPAAKKDAESAAAPAKKPAAKKAPAKKKAESED